MRTSTEPTSSENPFAIAGFIVYLATYLLILKLSLPDDGGSTDLPLCSFIL